VAARKLLTSALCRSVLSHIGLAVFLLPGIAAAQGVDRSQFDARANTLQSSLTDLNAQVEKLKATNLQLQRQMDNMRARLDDRLQRLEKAKAKPVPTKPKR
jgi:TolA-binding protein